tara:strand:+ start:241 stop:738 length:498 start_codon:yes stop_codon:yes gene_type:complete
MPSKSKSKGNAFERFIADDLTQVFGYNFERVPNSGAFVGGKNASKYSSLSKSQQLIYEGDILVPDELYHMKIECKSYKDFAFHQLFSENKLLDSWIEQAHSKEKHWFLIFKINRKGTFVLVDRSTYNYIEDHLTSPNYVKYKDYYIMSYDEFFVDTRHALISLTM